VDAQQLGKLRDALQTQRAALIAEGDLEVDRTTDEPVASKVDEDSAPLEEMSQVIASNRNRERAVRLRQIDAALARMKDDPEDFGLCEACGEEISTKRLTLLPWATSCITCQSEREVDRSSGRRRHLTDYD
jgi:DnaK suppressor protein